MFSSVHFFNICHKTVKPKCLFSQLHANILVWAWLLHFHHWNIFSFLTQRLKYWCCTQLSIQNVTCKRYSQSKSITCLPLCDSILRCFTKYSVWGAELRVNTSKCTVLFQGFCFPHAFDFCLRVSYVREACCLEATKATATLGAFL